MSYLQTGIARIGANSENIIKYSTTFIAAHSGCLLGPSISASASGALSPASSLVASVAFGIGAGWASERWLAHASAGLECPRCITSQMDTFRQNMKLIVPSVLIGLGVHVGNGLHGRHDHAGTTAPPLCRGTTGQTAVTTDQPSSTTQVKPHAPF